MRLLTLCIALLTAAWAARATSHARAVQDPTEAAERSELGGLIFQNSCLMCHGAALVEQQRLSATQWKAEVEKMISWGATLAPEEVEPLEAYLVAEFGPNNQRAPQRIQAPLAKPTHHQGDFISTGNPELGARLYARDCSTCHGADGRGGEPGQNLVQQPSLVDLANFRDVVAHGRRKMPGFSQVLNEAETEAIRAWLLQLRAVP